LSAPFPTVKFTLRTYSPADLETLYEIDQVCYEPDIAYSRRELRNYVEAPGADCVVGEESGKTAGFIVTAREEHWGYIVTIDVLEPYRRQQLGTLLLTEAERRLAVNEVHEVDLETAVNNPAGIAFWKRHGYRTLGICEGYYPGGIDAFSMRKTI
jgi:ribosomal-protein-alanine N-acetyltransferase